MNIAIVDDENDILFSLNKIISNMGHRVFTYISGKNIINEIKSNKINLVFMDINLNEGKTGIDYIIEIKEKYPELKIIAISGNSDIKTAVLAMKKGAYDFIEKPLERNDIEKILKEISEQENIKNERDRFFDDILEKYRIIGQSKAIEKLKEQILEYATLNENVLILGENGTGKELVAANLHYLSNRRKNKYYKINISSYPENLIESELFGYKKGSFSGAEKDYDGVFISANGSTLFIDEIGELKINLQAKLLRVIQEKEVVSIGSINPVSVDVRLIFATNKNLVDEISKNQFREDLYFRISTLVIQIPPLRERKEDIIILSKNFLFDFCNENNIPVKDFSNSAISKLMEYNYPGNVRELKNIITRAIINSKNKDIIDENCIDFCLNNQNNLQSDKENIKENIFKNIFYETKPLKDKKEELEDLYIKTQLEKFNNNLKETAKNLGILVNNLYRKL